MDYSSAFQISASGMAIEKMRLDITAANLANMNNAAPSPGAVYQPMRLIAHTAPMTFAQQFGAFHGLQLGGVEVAQVVTQPTAPRMVYEPGHPYADSKGFVSYPGIDHTAEMLNVNVALRAYEANVAAFNAAKVMASRTLDIGSQS